MKIKASTVLFFLMLLFFAFDQEHLGLLCFSIFLVVSWHEEE